MTGSAAAKNIPFMACPALGQLLAILLEAKALSPAESARSKMLINYE